MKTTDAGFAGNSAVCAVGPQTLASKVPVKLVQNMDDDGFPVKKIRPQAVTSTDTNGAARVVVIGYDGTIDAIGSAAAEHWDDVPPASLEYEDAKRKITSHIDKLLQDLGGQ